MSEFRRLTEVPVHLGRGRVFEHGWQSWSPTTTYPVTATSHRPVQPVMQQMCYRPGRPGPAHGFQGEGLLAVDPGTDNDPIRLYAAADPLSEAPSIRAELVGERLVISATVADGRVEEHEFDGPLESALAQWADGQGGSGQRSGLRAAPTVWCSWYQYFAEVTESDIVENLAAIKAHGLPVDVAQIDDGWQEQIGDWLTLSTRFDSLADLVGRIRATGLRAGVWTAPFLVAESSRLAKDHPEWLVGGAAAGRNWGQDLFALDVTNPGAAAYLSDVFATLSGHGFDYFKIDFLYAGALDGNRYRNVPALKAYRQGLQLIRDAIGDNAYLVGCGAPILPSVGLVDAMRVSADIDVRVEPDHGDLSRPSQRAAELSTIGRAWQHGRFWVNDPDCIIARPEAQHRAEWAETVTRFGGLRASSDRISALDDWGLETTRRLLSTVPPPEPFSS